VVDLVRVFRVLLAIASADLAASWQLAAQHATPPAALAIAAITLAGAVIALLGQTWWPGCALAAESLVRRAAALRRKSRVAAYQRQRNPHAPGRPRPRAPSAAPAAA
jgi:hypothetical protein